MTQAFVENEKTFSYQNLGTPMNVIKLEIKPMVSIILPAHNEAETIRGVIIGYYNEIVKKLPSKLIVAEDGSIDQTPEILASLGEQLPLTVLSDRNRKGYAKGVADALKASKEEWVFFSDSDGQYFPSDFWKLWANRKGYDMIIGQKVHRDEGLHRVFLSKSFHLIFNNLFGLKLHDADCGFRLIRKKVIESVLEETTILKYSFWAEFSIRSCLKGFRIREIPISHASRANGGTRIYSPSKLPKIICKQLSGLVRLYTDVKKPG